MIDLFDKNYCPTVEEMGTVIRNPLFEQFCAQVKAKHQCSEKMEYSACSWERGWNLKFKKAGRTLCTIYPREGYFTVMVVIGTREKNAAEAILPDCTKELQRIYEQTKEGNGQKWMTIDLEDRGGLYEDVLRLIEIRRG